MELPVPPDDILDVTRFSFAGNFDMQVMEILARVRLTRIEVENLQSVLDDVGHALSCVFPGVQVHPFGSIVTGLGIRTSDIDCYVEIAHEKLSKKKQMKLHKGLAVAIAKNVLQKSYDIFTQVTAIPSARVPIVKFVHIPTGFNCDVNFSSPSGVTTSKLIGFLLCLDPRALHLAIIVKYWTKVYNFTGTFLLPNFGLTMMIIFFLQVKSILPSIAELQRLQDARMINNWNTAFDDQFIYVTQNEDTLYQLLGSFFNYYKNFDYEQNVICPFLGCPIKKELLTNMSVLPTEYRLYKENVATHTCKVIRLDSNLCIQDPFEHNMNCSIGVYGQLFVKICAHFELAATMFNEKPRDDFLMSVLTMHPQVGSQIANTVIKPLNPMPIRSTRIVSRESHVTKKYRSYFKKRLRQKAREHLNRCIMETRRPIQGYIIGFSFT